MAKQMNVVITLTLGVQDNNTHQLLDRSAKLERLAKRWLTNQLTDERMLEMGDGVNDTDLYAWPQNVKVTIFPQDKE